MENKDVAFIRFNDELDSLLEQTQKECADFESGVLSEAEAREKIAQHKTQIQLLRQKLRRGVTP